MKKYFILTLVLPLLSGCFLLSQNVDDTTEGESVALPENVREVQDTAAVPSLEALMGQEFNGTDFTVGSILASEAAYTRYYITYTSGELTISGIMNVPVGPGPFPVLILNHGFIDPAIYTNGRGLKREQDYLARRGYVVVHPDYRNHADSDTDEDNGVNFRLGYTEDVINAVYAIRQANLPYVDGGKIGMLGHSMGGGITQNILVIEPDLVDAAVLFAPVASDYRDSHEKWIRRSDDGQKIFDLYGDYDDNPVFWNNLSSRTFFENISAPILLHHGTEDESVPLEWSDHTVEALEQLGKDITYYTYEGELHEFINQWPLVMQRTVDFFDDHLK